MFDRIYPYVGGRLVFNDREKKFGIGPYGRYHFSENLIVATTFEEKIDSVKIIFRGWGLGSIFLHKELERRRDCFLYIKCRKAYEFLYFGKQRRIKFY